MAIRICAKCKKVIAGIGVPYGGHYYHEHCFVCSYCGGNLIGAKVVSYSGHLYHAECNPATGKLVCAYCHKKITGGYYSLNDKYYHDKCYHQHIEKVCSICGQPIKGEYYYDKWGNSAHVSHNGEKTQFCFTCGRILAAGNMSVADDITLCNVCALTSVTTDEHVERCRKKVLSVFKSLGVTGIPEAIPIELCPHEKMEGNLGCIHYKVVKDPVLANFRIRMTYGLPELHFMGVLAHEMLHSWLALYGRTVTKDECEGFCNLGEAFIYTKDDSRLAHYLLKRMYNSADAVYGDGYRLQKERYEKLGWAGLLNSLRHD